jgi:DHA2 family multidrug resistance protein-like MFS transporter
LGTGIVISSVAPQKAGAAAAVSQTGNEFGFALGIAIVGSIGTAVYRFKTDTLPPGLTDSTTTAVRDTLAAATAATEKLPAAVHDQVLHIARSAFVQEYHTVAIISAVVLAATAAVIVVRLKGLPAIGDANQEN